MNHSPLLVVLAFLAVPTATSHASTVSVSAGSYGAPGGVVRYEGSAAGSTVRFIQAADGALDVVDTEPITAGRGCTPFGLLARCTGHRSIVASGGGGDDVIDVSRAGRHYSRGNPVQDVLARLGAPDLGFAAVLRGGDGDDALIGGSAGDLLDGGAGADRMTGGRGGDVVDYSARTAPLTVTLGTGADGEAGEGDEVGDDVEHLLGGAGHDTLSGSAAGNTIAGGGGDDRIVAGDARDALIGGSGADTLEAGRGDDDGVGGAGDDTVIGGAGADELTGDADDDTLHGGDGDDRLDPGTGDDVSDGGNGADAFVTGSGADVFDGGDNSAAGPQEDVLRYEDAATGLTLTLDGVADDGPDADDNAVRFERLDGTPFADVLVGDALGNRILGLGGDDQVAGGLGADVLEGGEGDDFLNSGDDDDVDRLDCGDGMLDEATFDLEEDVFDRCEVLHAR